MEDAGEERPIFRDIMRYFYKYCGICRSKKFLIASHILTHHKVKGFYFLILFELVWFMSYVFVANVFKALKLTKKKFKSNKLCEEWD